MFFLYFLVLLRKALITNRTQRNNFPKDIQCKKSVAQVGTIATLLRLVKKCRQKIQKMCKIWIDTMKEKTKDMTIGMTSTPILSV